VCDHRRHAYPRHDAVRPIEVFRLEEQPLLLPAPGQPFDTPTWCDPVVHRDFHCSVAKAIYTVPYHLVGRTLRARADSTTVKFYFRGELVKLHPRQPPGGRSSDPADFPKGKEIYATRDLDALQARASSYGPSVGAYAAAVLDTPLPWTKMRQVYRLISMVQKWGAERVDQACAKALDAEAINVNLISRMLERAREDAETESRPDSRVVQGRFEREASEFEATKGANR